MALALAITKCPGDVKQRKRKTDCNDIYEDDDDYNDDDDANNNNNTYLGKK
jgi:hypothetical protein